MLHEYKLSQGKQYLKYCLSWFTSFKKVIFSDLTYAETANDEVEDLFNLLLKAKNETSATAVCRYTQKKLWY